MPNQSLVLSSIGIFSFLFLVLRLAQIYLILCFITGWGCKEQLFQLWVSQPHGEEGTGFSSGLEVIEVTKSLEITAQGERWNKTGWFTPEKKELSKHGEYWKKMGEAVSCLPQTLMSTDFIDIGNIVDRFYVTFLSQLLAFSQF